MHKPLATLATLAIALAAGVALAAGGHAGHGGAEPMNHAQMAQASSAHDMDKMSGMATMSDGVVKKVDNATGKLTLQHGPLHNLDMPAMTMVFRVKDAATLDQLKPGDKIHFVAEDINGTLTVVRYEKAM